MGAGDTGAVLDRRALLSRRLGQHQTWQRQHGSAGGAGNQCRVFPERRHHPFRYPPAGVFRIQRGADHAGADGQAAGDGCQGQGIERHRKTDPAAAQDRACGTRRAGAGCFGGSVAPGRHLHRAPRRERAGGRRRAGRHVHTGREHAHRRKHAADQAGERQGLYRHAQPSGHDQVPCNRRRQPHATGCGGAPGGTGARFESADPATGRQDLRHLRAHRAGARRHHLLRLAARSTAISPMRSSMRCRCWSSPVPAHWVWRHRLPSSSPAAWPRAKVYW